MGFVGLARIVGRLIRNVLLLGMVKEEGFDFIIGAIVVLLVLYLIILNTPA